MIRVLIVDDILILRQGLKAILSQDKEIQVVGLAKDGMEACRMCRELKPDVVLMDMRMPDYDGGWGTGKIKAERPKTRVLALTTFDDKETVSAALASGADGYILKEMADDMVIRSVKAVYSGASVFDQSVFEGIREDMMKRAVKPAFPDGFLTPREMDILRLVAQGMDNKEIAASLYLAEGTVRNQISRLLEKLKLKDRTQLAVFAVKHNLD